MSEKLAKGTANLIHQDAAYRELKNEYGESIATGLASRNLQKNGVDVPPDGIASWAKVNSAAIGGRLDIDGERAKAEALAATAMGTAIQNASLHSQTPEPKDQPEDELEDDQDQDQDQDEDEDEEEDEEEEEEEEEEGPDYGYDNEEDNDEAALDDVLKIQENS